MGDFLKRFWTTAASMATLVGLYVAAETVDLQWAFWITLAIALSITAMATAVPRAVDLLVKARKYPALLKEIARLDEELNEANATVERYGNEVEKGWKEGVVEGRAQVLGVYLAAGVAPPTVVAIADLNGEIALVGRDESDEVPLEARFAVQTRETGELRGVVEASQRGSENGVVYLSCVTATVPAFWERLAQRVLHDPSPPSGIELVPCTANHLPVEKRGSEPIAAPQPSPEDEL